MTAVRRVVIACDYCRHTHQTKHSREAPARHDFAPQRGVEPDARVTVRTVTVGEWEDV